jgi:adenosylcobinamide kinase/adenosylcobinamide-phosphate guanylyltransferase
MKILYFGGQKSGKSKLAEQHSVEVSKSKPFYIATYDNSYGDESMIDRVLKHKQMREDMFETIEESVDIDQVVNENNTYLIDSISMWVFNTLDLALDEVYEILEELFKKDANLIFVIDDVSSGVIPIDKISRKFVDRNGMVGQKIVSLCDEVYEVKFGLKRRAK